MYEYASFVGKLNMTLRENSKFRNGGIETPR